MTGTEPAAERTSLLAQALTEGNAAEMCADADDDQPFRAMDTRDVRLRVLEVGVIVSPGSSDPLGRPAVDKDRLAPPFHCYPLARSNWAKVYLY